MSECPGIIPKMDCSGNPCDGASCPGYSEAVCVPDYCGHCKAVWYVDDQVVQCSGILPTQIVQWNCINKNIPSQLLMRLCAFNQNLFRCSSTVMEWCAIVPINRLTVQMIQCSLNLELIYVVWCTLASVLTYRVLY